MPPNLECMTWSMMTELEIKLSHIHHNVFTFNVSCSESRGGDNLLYWKSVVRSRANLVWNEQKNTVRKYSRVENVYDHKLKAFHKAFESSLRQPRKKLFSTSQATTPDFRDSSPNSLLSSSRWFCFIFPYFPQHTCTRTSDIIRIVWLRDCSL